MMIQKMRFLISDNSQYIITTLKLNLTHYEHSPINIGDIQSISNSGIIPTFLVPPDGPWLAGPCFCEVGGYTDIRENALRFFPFAVFSHLERV